MQVDLIKNLPPEITFDIILRLPVKTICICKCVSKQWLGLLESPDFVNFHRSKSLPGVVVSQIVDTTKQYRYLVSMNDHSASLNFSFPKPHRLLGSANGLLFLVENSERPQNFYICNPLTRNFISVPCPRRNNSTVLPRQSEMGTFGFGVSRKTGEFKLVNVYQEITTSNGVYTHSECEVYTLVKGPWRSIAPGEMFTSRRTPGLYLNGNLYWLDVVSKDSEYIRCFDLENERFSTLSPPPCYGDYFSYLCIMEGCLCYCYNSPNRDINIWLMTEGGGVKSWTKKPVISKPRSQYDIYFPDLFDLAADLKDGDILMGAAFHESLFNYSSGSGVAEETDLLAVDDKLGAGAVRYTPSFISLRPFSRGCDLESI